ncbi:hypothetical protein Lal_00042102 [Lupinus albus]|nr:hypothetical protein Lal_00042102 [Lupinus albus]
MGDLLGSPRVAPLSFSHARSIPGLETVEVVFLDSWGGTDRRSLSQWIEWEILPQMHILCVEFRLKRAWARVVLGWVTSWEVLVLHLSLFPTPGAFPDSKQ